MSILFSHFLSRNNEIVPQKADFTEVLDTIAVTPKKLYFYGKLPENRVLDEDFESTKNAVLDGVGGLKKAAAADGLARARTSTVAGSATDSGARRNVRAERPKTVAIVGTRKPTAYGAGIARKLAYECAKRGAVVVSGLAYGIDSIAHRGALEAGGVTVAVLGTPIDYIYPKAHLGLAEEIVRTGGAVMSELAPGAEFQAKTCFLRRNRIISGLADVVVIVEAAERSGSLNTAAHALEQGKEIFAVPGDVTRVTSMGCNRLIQQGGANVYTEVEDVLRVLFPPKRKKKVAQAQLLIGDTVEETAILQLIGRGIEAGEEIIAQAGLTVAKFNQNVTMLELKGRIMPLGMNKWALK